MTKVEINPSRLSLGSKVSVITGAQYRYEGTVAAINSIEGTLTLQNVCFWGSENRTVENTVGHTGDKKPPAVGSIFNLITFWMSSIVQVWLSRDGAEDKNEIGDRGIAKAGIPVDVNRGSRGRRSRGWWQSGDPARSVPHTNSPTNAVDNGNSYSAGRYSTHNQSRMLVSYPRRGRNATIYPRHTGYVPVVPLVHGTGSGGLRRATYATSARSPAYHGAAGSRMSGRRGGEGPRYAIGAGGDYGYHHQLNAPGGVLVYLPPDMAAAYQSHGINFVPSRPSGRRMGGGGERRNVSRGPESTEPEFDCTTPYDFEAANAEFKEELEKITINADGVPVTITSQAGAESNAGTRSTDNQQQSTTTTLRSSSSTISAAGNGASGDSTRAGVTAPTESAVDGSVETDTPLAKGEYYVREKCFFDQISRPENTPRNTTAGYPTDSSRMGARGVGYGPNPGVSRRLSYGPGFNSITAARRERQLNIETFGSIAARTTFIPRRRVPGPPRDYLISAHA